jgi:hypothetical protein
MQMNCLKDREKTNNTKMERLLRPVLVGIGLCNLMTVW